VRFHLRLGLALGLALCAGLSSARTLFAAPPPAAAQEPGGRVLVGRVLKAGAPVAGVPVTLHRVTAAASGPLATRTSGADGSFRFTLPPADTGFAVFFTTADYLSVRYFGPPVHRDETTTGYEVAVHDTSSSLPGALKTVRRDLVLLPQTDGGWEVDEIVRVRNTSDRTLVPQPGQGTWEFHLPAGATDFETGEGDVTAEQLRVVGDRVFLVTSLVPGDRDVYVRYRLPAGREASAVTLRDGADTVNVFVQQPSPEITVAPLVARPPVTVEGEKFLQFSGTSVAPGTSLALHWSAPARLPFSPVVAGIGAALLILAVGTAAAVRNRELPA
jgi:hypothetical protein